MYNSNYSESHFYIFINSSSGLHHCIYCKKACFNSMLSFQPILLNSALTLSKSAGPPHKNPSVLTLSLLSPCFLSACSSQPAFLSVILSIPISLPSDQSVAPSLSPLFLSAPSHICLGRAEAAKIAQQKLLMLEAHWNERAQAETTELGRPLERKES